jgi:4-hydroxy-2-oxoheptanedioate aldolase
MRKNNILEKMRAGEKAYGCSLIFPSADIIELLGIAGFDYVFLDGEHGPFTPEIIEQMCRVADAAGLTPIARVPNIQSSTILQFLDRGVMGIMGPHICTGEHAQALADACRFAPLGKRSFGSGRGTHYGDPVQRRQYMQQANDEMLVIALLEDVEVTTNLSDILSVEGIDFFSYGPNDLAQSMGLPGEPEHPKVQELMVQTTSRIRAAGKKIMSDAMVSARAAELILDGAREFLRNPQQS